MTCGVDNRQAFLSRLVLDQGALPTKPCVPCVRPQHGPAVSSVRFYFEYPSRPYGVLVTNDNRDDFQQSQILPRCVFTYASSNIDSGKVIEIDDEARCIEDLNPHLPLAIRLLCTYAIRVITTDRAGHRMRCDTTIKQLIPQSGLQLCLKLDAA